MAPSCRPSAKLCSMLFLAARAVRASKSCREAASSRSSATTAAHGHGACQQNRSARHGHVSKKAVHGQGGVRRQKTRMNKARRNATTHRKLFQTR